MKARRWPTRWPSTSCRRSITCRKRRRRSNRPHGEERREATRLEPWAAPSFETRAAPAPQDEAELVCIFLENRLDRAVPRAVEFLQQLLRRRRAARDRLLE